MVVVAGNAKSANFPRGEATVCDFSAIVQTRRISAGNSVARRACVCVRARAFVNIDRHGFPLRSFSSVAILSGRDLANRHIAIHVSCSVFAVSRDGAGREEPSVVAPRSPLPTFPPFFSRRLPISLSPLVHTLTGTSVYLRARLMQSGKLSVNNLFSFSCAHAVARRRMT